MKEESSFSLFILLFDGFCYVIIFITAFKYIFR